MNRYLGILGLLLLGGNAYGMLPMGKLLSKPAVHKVVQSPIVRERCMRIIGASGLACVVHIAFARKEDAAPRNQSNQFDELDEAMRLACAGSRGYREEYLQRC